MDKLITPGQVSDRLEISPSTLRKYCILIEESGYTFKRNAKNSRQYTESDVITLQKMITLVKTDGVTLDNAAYAVTRGNGSTTNGTDESDVTHDGVQRHDSDVSPLLIAEVRMLREQIEQQQKVIEGFQEAQDKRDTLFVNALENMQGEIERMTEWALPTPEEPEKPEARKGFFARLFK